VARCQAVFLSVILVLILIILIVLILVLVIIVIVEVVVVFIFVVIEVVFVLVLVLIILIVLEVVLILVFVLPARSHDSGQWDHGAGATGKLALQTQYLQQINNVRHEKISLETGWSTKRTEEA